jgi:hypothetical protein
VPPAGFVWVELSQPAAASAADDAMIKKNKLKRSPFKFEALMIRR